MDRRTVIVSGLVQGVGFRPFVQRLASRHGLHGFVKNRAGGVLIEVEGPADALDRFLIGLTAESPTMAQIDEVSWVSQPPLGELGFRIDPSIADAAGNVFVPPDVATCDDCLAELFDPEDRRFRYPFLNCASCGPRLTIIEGMPYDRPRTSMTTFAMCPSCRSEYEDPRDRRFHAQPIACPSCGPRLSILDGQGRPVASDDPLSSTVEALRRGLIVAVKGIGGYHLVCDARDDRAVAELRRRKHRDEKPLAIMAADLDAARQLVEVSEAEGELLRSPRRPIVLLRRRPGSSLAVGVAPRAPWLGLMLPYTPLHHLLLRAMNGAPLVMTSGNRSDEPIAHEDSDATARLGGIADGFLTHNRPIRLRCDDSVTRVVAGFESPIRRGRGESPRPIDLPVSCRVPTLAMGGQLKVTFALGRGHHAFLSHHIGDLDDYGTYRGYVEAIAHYERLFSIRPELLVHDLHPDYASSALARRSEGAGRLFAVQHHHAHMASCMAENGLDEPVIGVTFDGTGYGLDGAIWGGEFLIGDYRAFRRAAHLRDVAIPGGERAIREPWRMAASYLVDAGLGFDALRDRVPERSLSVVRQMIDRRFQAPMTSSVGRLFDAVAALAGLRDRVAYEGQSAIELEWLAAEVAPDGLYPFDLDLAWEGEPPRAIHLIDPRPLIAAVVDDSRIGRDPAVIGRRFHSTIVEIIAQVCGQLRAETGLATVVLSGGVFLNALLTTEVVERLDRDGFRAYRHRRVPPNDGGLSLGQLAVSGAVGSRQ